LSFEKVPLRLKNMFPIICPASDRQYPKAALDFCILKLIKCAAMGTAQKPNPELSPIGRPRCPKCQMRMMTADISPGPEGFEHRTFECVKCDHTEKKILACDPLRSNAIGWLSGELGRDAVTHEVHNGQMIPKPAQ
jgi:hypothetical protein